MNRGRSWLVVLVAVVVTAAGSASAAWGTPVPGRLHQSALLTMSTSDTTRKQGGDVDISADGHTVVVSAPPMNRSHNRDGAVVVYVGGGSSWTRQTTLRRAPDPVAESAVDSNWGASVALSADGDHIAVADPYNSIVGTNGRAASVDLFRRVGSTWSADGQAADPYPVPWSQFGYSLALSGDGSRLLVGAPFYAGPAIPRGSGVAWLYTRDSGGWGPGQKLLAPGPTRYVQFGAAVALSGDGNTALVGSEFVGWSTTDYNDGRVFTYTPGPAGTLTFSHAFVDPVHSRDAFGAAIGVSIDGRTVAVGNPWSSPPSVVVYERPGAGWNQVATFTGTGPARSGLFGQATVVSGDGDTVLVGAPQRPADDGAAPAAGAGYRFVRDGTGWHWGGLLSPLTTTAYKNVGASVALSGDGSTAVLGAPFTGQSTLDGFRHPGAAYVFTR